MLTHTGNTHIDTHIFEVPFCWWLKRKVMELSVILGKPHGIDKDTIWKSERRVDMNAE